MPTIKIVKDKRISTNTTNFYSVIVGGETVFECMSEAEVSDLTIKEIMNAWFEVEPY